MKLNSIKILISILLFCISPFLFAQPNSLHGSWRIHDHEGHARSIITFYSRGDKVEGKLIKILPLAGKDTERCTQCKNPYNNKPLKGLVIVWGLQQQGEKWTNGKILDTDSGRTYNCSITLSRDGRTLHFYAYLFGPLGATIDWYRID